MASLDPAAPCEADSAAEMPGRLGSPETVSSPCYCPLQPAAKKTMHSRLDFLQLPPHKSADHNQLHTAFVCGLSIASRTSSNCQFAFYTQCFVHPLVTAHHNQLQKSQCRVHSTFSTFISILLPTMTAAHKNCVQSLVASRNLSNGQLGFYLQVVVHPLLTAHRKQLQIKPCTFGLTL
jgi:hypothetical protein